MHVAVMVAEVISIIYLLIILVSMFFTENKSATTFCFIACLVVAIFGTVMDFLSYFLEQVSTGPVLLTIVNMISFFGFDFELIAFAYYIWALLTEKGEISRSLLRFIIAMSVFDLLFVVAGTFTGKLFYIDNGTFVTGPLYNFGGVIGFIILVSLFIFTLRKRKKVGNKPLGIIILFFILTYAPIFLTLFTGADSYMYVCLAIAMMFVYIILQAGEIERIHLREQIILEVSNTDVLTKLNNRRSFDKVLVEVSDIPNVGVVFCDVNSLKITNDNYGHAAGDELLKNFASILKNIFKYDEIFRISGDEFVVISKNVEEKDFVHLVNKLSNEISKNKEIASIGFSYGNGSTIIDMISNAETVMYAAKKDYYIRNNIKDRI